MLQHFVRLPTFLTVELSSKYIDKLFFPLTMDVLGENYVLKGMVRCTSHHFTVAVQDGIHWVYIDDMCVSVRHYTSFQDLLQSHLNGWFFAIFEKSSTTIFSETETNSETCETLEQQSNNLFVGTLPIDIPSTDNTNNFAFTTQPNTLKG